MTTTARRQQWPEIMTTAQAAEYMQVSDQHVRERIRDDGLPAMRVGHYFRIPKHRMDEWIDQQLAREKERGE